MTVQFTATVDQAVARLSSDAKSGAPAPRPYPEIARLGYRWIKIHRYWLGYKVTETAVIITNVHFETSNIPGNVVAKDDV